MEVHLRDIPHRKTVTPTLGPRSLRGHTGDLKVDRHHRACAGFGVGRSMNRGAQPIRLDRLGLLRLPWHCRRQWRATMGAECIRSQNRMDYFIAREVNTMQFPSKIKNWRWRWRWRPGHGLDGLHPIARAGAGCDPAGPSGNDRAGFQRPGRTERGGGGERQRDRKDPTDRGLARTRRTGSG